VDIGFALVTSRAVFIGGHLMRMSRLVSNYWKVRALDNISDGRMKRRSRNSLITSL